VSAAPDDLRIVGGAPLHELMSEREFKSHVIDRLGDLTERLETLSDSMPSAAQLQDAVAGGMRQALDDPEIWTAAMKGLSKAAQQEAGGWLFAGIRTALSRLAWLLVLGMLVYQFGGWSALTSIFKPGAP
jgi:hypothetical protein